MSSSKRFGILTDYPDSPPATPSLGSPTLDVFCLSPRMISWADEKQEEVDAEEAARNLLGVADDVQGGWRFVLTESCREGAAAPDVISSEDKVCDGADCGSAVGGEETAHESIDSGGFVAGGDIFDDDVFDGHIFGGIFDDDVVDGSIVEGDVHVHGGGILNGDGIFAETSHASASNSKHVDPVPDSWDEYMDSISGGFMPLHLTVETRAPKNTWTGGLSYAKAASAGLNTNSNGFLVLQETNGVAAPQVEDSPSSHAFFERLTKPKKKSMEEEVKAAAGRSETSTTQAVSTDTSRDLQQVLLAFETVMHLPTTSLEIAVAMDDTTEPQAKIPEASTVQEDIEPIMHEGTELPLSPPLGSDVDSISIPFNASAGSCTEVTTPAKYNYDQPCVTETSSETANHMTPSANEKEEVVQTSEYREVKHEVTGVAEADSKIAIEITKVVDNNAKDVIGGQVNYSEEKEMFELVTVRVKKQKLSGAQRRKAANAAAASKASGDICVWTQGVMPVHISGQNAIWFILPVLFMLFALSLYFLV